MNDRHMRQSKINRAIPWLILVILALTLLAYGTARMVAVLAE
jgi:hypothetical protein